MIKFVHGISEVAAVKTLAGMLLDCKVAKRGDISSDVWDTSINSAHIALLWDYRTEKGIDEYLKSFALDTSISNKGTLVKRVKVFTNLGYSYIVKECRIRVCEMCDGDELVVLHLYLSEKKSILV